MTRYRKDGQPWGAMHDAWNLEQETRLRDLAGTCPVPEIAERLSDEFATPRTVAAVRVRARRLGLSLWAQGWSLRDVERLFRLHHRAIVRWWVEPGLLPGTRWAGRGPHAGWWFDPDAVERFVREHGYAYDWRRMDPRHPLAGLAQATNRRDPWVTYAETAAYVGIAPANLDRWRKRGLVPHQRRPKGGPGAGLIVVRASALPAIREAIRAAQRRARQTTTAQFTARRRGLEAA